MVLPKSTTSLCYIDNLIDAVLLAEKKGRNGDIYHVADETPYSWRQLIFAIQRELQLNFRIIHVSHTAARMGAFFFEGISRFSSKFEPPLHKGRIKTLTNNFAWDITKAKTQLGYTPRVSLEEGLKSTIQWYYSEGLIS
jgi:nucleoside-diphosphate-sugar epimerase